MEKNKRHYVDLYKLYVLYISSTGSINTVIRQEERKFSPSLIQGVSKRALQL